jgi:hypothetical protein
MASHTIAWCCGEQLLSFMPAPKPVLVDVAPPRPVLVDVGPEAVPPRPVLVDVGPTPVSAPDPVLDALAACTDAPVPCEDEGLPPPPLTTWPPQARRSERGTMKRGEESR